MTNDSAGVFEKSQVPLLFCLAYLYELQWNWTWVLPAVVCRLEQKGVFKLFGIGEFDIQRTVHRDVFLQ